MRLSRTPGTSRAAFASGASANERPSSQRLRSAPSRNRKRFADFHSPQPPSPRLQSLPQHSGKCLLHETATCSHRTDSIARSSRAESYSCPTLQGNHHRMISLQKIGGGGGGTRFPTRARIRAEVLGKRSFGGKYLPASHGECGQIAWSFRGKKVGGTPVLCNPQSRGFRAQDGPESLDNS